MQNCLGRYDLIRREKPALLNAVVVGVFDEVNKPLIVCSETHNQAVKLGVANLNCIVFFKISHFVLLKKIGDRPDYAEAV